MTAIYSMWYSSIEWKIGHNSPTKATVCIPYQGVVESFMFKCIHLDYFPFFHCLPIFFFFLPSFTFTSSTSFPYFSLFTLLYILFFFFSLEFKHLFSFLFSFTSPLHNDFSRAYIFIILIQFIHFIHYSLTAYILLIISSLYDVLCNAFQKVLIKLLNNVWVIYENYLKKHRLSEETI